MNLNGVISENDLSISIKQYLEGENFKISSVNVSKASSTEMIGFVGDHFRIQVQVKYDGEEKTLPFFVKTLPMMNHDKRKYIIDFKFFLKEFIMYSKIFLNFKGDEEPSPWRPKILHATEKCTVMVDLATRNFKSFDKRTYMNLEHCTAALTSVAKFHASILTYEHRRSKELGVPYEVVSEYDILRERTNFTDCPWFRTGSKLALDFLDAFSVTYNSKAANWANIKIKLPLLFLKACDRLDKSERFRNVILHADLWANNLMFRYDQVSKPIDVALVDYQCIRYGAYGSDISSFLYLNTARTLRHEHEKQLLKHYHRVLNDELSSECESLKEPWTSLEENFEHCRIFGLVHAIMIFPYTNLKGEETNVFDNPQTFVYLNEVNRSDVIVGIAKADNIYRKRLLETLEEFLERYIL